MYIAIPRTSVYAYTVVLRTPCSVVGLLVPRKPTVLRALPWGADL